MRMRPWIYALFFTGLFGQQAFAQTAEPKFEIQSIAMPSIGEGLPDHKPMDILGVYSGMSGEAALPILNEFNKRQPKNRLYTVMLTLRFAAKPYLGFAMSGAAVVGEERDFDYIGITLTSNASGNQIVEISRTVGYERGHEANADQTLSAIIAKYGEPSAREEPTSSGRTTLIYAYKNGSIVKDENACTGLRSVAGWSQGGFPPVQHLWYQALFGAAQANLTGSFSEQAKNCSAYMAITLKGLYLDPSRYNMNAVSTVTFVFFDAARFMVANDRDLVVQKELMEKAKNSQAAGTGVPKL